MVDFQVAEVAGVLADEKEGARVPVDDEENDEADREDAELVGVVGGGFDLDAELQDAAEFEEAVGSEEGPGRVAGEGEGERVGWQEGREKEDVEGAHCEASLLQTFGVGDKHTLFQEALRVAEQISK